MSGSAYPAYPFPAPRARKEKKHEPKLFMNHGGTISSCHKVDLFCLGQVGVIETYHVLLSGQFGGDS